MSFIPRTARIGSLMSISRRELHRGFDRDARLLLRRVATQAPAFPISSTDVFLDQLLEFLGDPLAFQSNGLDSIHVDRRDRALAGPGEADADIGVLAFAGPVDDAAHDRDVHVFDSGVALAPLRHLLAQEALDLFGQLLEIGAGGAAATRASDHHRRERAQTHRLEQLQTMGLRSFSPMVIACPGCGRTTSTIFQELAEKIQRFLREQMPQWRERYPGVEDMHVAVMGCVVNGPGESKHANIGISLPGSGERPVAPVYVDGVKTVTLI